MKTSRRVHIIQFGSSQSEHRLILDAICDKTAAQRSLVSSFQEALELIQDDPERDIVILDYALLRSECAYENDNRLNAGHVNAPTLSSSRAFTGASIPETGLKALAGSPEIGNQAIGVHAFPFEQACRTDRGIFPAQLLRTDTYALSFSRCDRFREEKDLQQSLNQQRKEITDHDSPSNNTWLDDDTPNSMVKGWWIIPSLVLGGLFWFVALRHLMLWFSK